MLLGKFMMCTLYGHCGNYKRTLLGLSPPPLFKLPCFQTSEPSLFVTVYGTAK